MRHAFAILAALMVCTGTAQAACIDEVFQEIGATREGRVSLGGFDGIQFTFQSRILKGKSCEPAKVAAKTLWDEINTEVNRALQPSGGDRVAENRDVNAVRSNLKGLRTITIEDCSSPPEFRSIETLRFCLSRAPLGRNVDRIKSDFPVLITQAPPLPGNCLDDVYRAVGANEREDEAGGVTFMVLLTYGTERTFWFESELLGSSCDAAAEAAKKIMGAVSQGVGQHLTTLEEKSIVLPVPCPNLDRLERIVIEDCVDPGPRAAHPVMWDRGRTVLSICINPAFSDPRAIDLFEDAMADITSGVDAILSE